MKIRLEKAVTPFSLEHTLCSGQVFRWENSGNLWYGVIDENVVKIRQTRNELVFQSYPKKLGLTFLQRYFRLDDDLPRILSRVSKDEHVTGAIRRLYGLRIVRQDPWECLISFICATNKNISAIKGMILNLCRRFGRKLLFDNRVFYTFPKPSVLAEADLGDVKECKLGFRGARVLQTSRIIADEKFDFQAISKMDYERAKQELMSLPGVGNKVADCLLLFSFDKLEAFPIDVWMKRIVLESYSRWFERSFVDSALLRNSITPMEYEKINSFGRLYFGEYAGYAQEYLFYARLSTGKVQHQTSREDRSKTIESLISFLADTD